MTDTQPTQPLPDPAAQWVLSSSGEPRRRRRAWPWIVAIVVIAVLAAAAWFAGEWIARDLVSKTIRQQVITSLALPADQPIDVTIEGAVLPQLIGGRLDDVTVASDDVSLGQLTGDVSVHAQGIGLGDPPTARAATATVSLDAAQVQALLTSTAGGNTTISIDSLALAEPNVTAGTSLSVLGLPLPVALSLTPSAAEGQLVLTPASVQVAGAELSAADLRSRFGGVADTLLGGWNICVAKYLPVGLTLTSVAVQGDMLVAGLNVDPAIATDPALSAKGTCA
ncbi:LmeA family phospholipid-binding protein [Microbacterium rhizomatis]|uniref:DUF2993 domain-containing protein n=1 Tax=Microbacterium rhizomatis TaxID=1631477 RepID=A0A5J5J4X0_9MICO|nr:DUF2993 domain-containing protein [Microbacterium rhizomatis]KAA9111136.1 DUF2993 domain-containing protein [Microbacterium rhizomatis]